MRIIVQTAWGKEGLDITHNDILARIRQRDEWPTEDVEKIVCNLIKINNEAYIAGMDNALDKACGFMFKICSQYSIKADMSKLRGELQKYVEVKE